MRRRSRSLAAGALIAVTVAGCGTAATVRSHDPQGATGASRRLASPSAPPSVLFAGWRALRLPSGAVLPYPAGWRPISGDPRSASAALFDRAGAIRAYLNVTPADGHEKLAGWARFRVRHNAAEGDRNLRLISARTDVRLDAGRASCVLDAYTTSRSRYRERACILDPADHRPAMVLVAAAQPNAWPGERPLLDFAIDHFTS